MSDQPALEAQEDAMQPAKPPAYAQMTDLELMILSQNDDPVAAAPPYAHLVSRLWGPILGYHRRLGNSDPDEATQETFVIGWINRKEFDPNRCNTDSCVRNWFFGIARNVTRRARNNQRIVPDPVDDLAIQARDPNPEQIVALEELRQDFETCWARLSAEAKDLLLLYYRQHNGNLREIAAALGVDWHTAKNRFIAARNRLCACLKGKGHEIVAEDN
jgi:RNA polymerase sigma factor (sigma-70 family)